MSDEDSLCDLSRFAMSGFSSQSMTPKRSSLLRKPISGVNLQKSIQMLDDAMGLPIGAQDSSFQSFRSPNTSQFNRKSFSTTSVASPFPVSSLRKTTNKSFSESVFLPPANSPVNQSLMEGVFDDVTTTNLGLLLQDDPELAACTGVYSEFQQAFKESIRPQQLFDLLKQYEAVCAEHLQLLKTVIMRAAPNQVKYNKKLDVYNLLYAERCTWQLLISLLINRLEDSQMEQDGEESMTLKYPSEYNLMSRLFKKDSSVREAQIVVDWLESCSHEYLSTLADNPEFYSGKEVAWENTLHRLRKRKQIPVSETERPLIDELDPDAPLRQGKALDDLDQEDDLILLQRMFACIRAGDIDQAQKISCNHGQAWRAASLEGWRLYHDANFEVHNEENLQPVEGNLFRDVWKRVSWAVCQENRYNIYEKAIYAAFSGNLKALLPACRSWSDYLWAYFRTYVDQMVEEEIRLNCSRKMEDLPNNYFLKRYYPESIFSEIESANNPEIQEESKIWFNVIQKFIILNDTNSLVDTMHDWLKKDNQIPQHLVRFMAHLVLVLRTVGLEEKEEKCNEILQGYVDLLIQNKMVHQVATYVATLPRSWQASAYALFLEGVEKKDERHLYLELAKEAGLAVDVITKTVVENIRKRDDPTINRPTSNINSTISKEDKQKIEAIDWLTFDPSQRLEAVKQANAVMRGFLAMNKPTAARQVFEKLPSDSVGIITRIWHEKFDSEELATHEENVVREYHCIKACLDAIESFNDWFELYHHSKPSAPERPENADFKDRIAYEHELKQFEIELDQWKHRFTMQTRTTKGRIYNVLLFPEGGWMVDKRSNTVIDESRDHQMKLLRQIYVPNFVTQLHQVLSLAEHHAECMQLSELITDDKNCLYEVFSQEDLQQILKLLRQSALILINQKQDPFGYEDPMSYEMEMAAT
ncbi:pore complex Nup107-like [Octopus vulgaris]|uniref:Pore complex Nup107-like n=2 Tax=Octopus TaxID=6643 RepID=A0AA36FM10_OCTVU|nr:nuclear pore complex protein Nup107 [Octopus sinensis]CAI9738848.1 pore complex Nup107-like [Octopus vulgaris]